MDNSEGIKQPNECLKDGSSNEHISIHFFIYQPNLTKSQKEKDKEKNTLQNVKCLIINKRALYYLGLVIITSPIFNTKKAQLSL